MSPEEIRIARRIGFTAIKGLSYSAQRDLLERVGGVDRFFEADRNELWRLTGTTSDLCTDAARRALLDKGLAEIEFITRHGIGTAFIGEDGYPRRLAECADSPLTLYRLGQCNLDSAQMIAIVGTRNATAYGCEFTQKMVKDLAATLDNPVIVSGLAYGIDISAHKAALDAGIPTVAVLGHGLNTIYPAEHRNAATRILHAGGALVTEYTSTSPIHRGNFPARNRIIAGMCDVTVVVESDARGGAMSTARLADDYGRSVAAVPGRVTDRFSRGCNALIYKNRASIVRDASDLAEMMMWKKRGESASQPEFTFPAMTAEQEEIVAYLRKNPDATLDDMTADLNVPYSTLCARVMEMEMDDMLVSRPGGTYMLKI